MGSGGTEVPFNGGKPQGLITLQQAIVAVSGKLECSRDSFDDYRRELGLLLAAAKAFACEWCDGNSYDYGCPACADFRRVAREGVEG